MASLSKYYLALVIIINLTSGFALVLAAFQEAVASCLYLQIIESLFSAEYSILSALMCNSRVAIVTLNANYLLK